MTTDIVNEMISLLLADSGKASVGDETYLIVQTAWDALDPADKDYILKLTKQDLENILCGASDEDESGATLWEVGNAWVAIPSGVEEFLDSVFNTVTSEG